MVSANKAYQYIRREWSLILLISIGALIQIFLITRSLDFLISNLLPDDAFYYFQVARHIVAGNGSTFDGIHPTNGYHPLWMTVLLPIYHWFSSGGINDLAPIRAALALAVFMNTMSAFSVARILSRFTSSMYIRAYGLMLWVLNPYLIYESLNGLETSLALFLFTLFTLLIFRAEEHRTSWGYMIAGVVGGLMTLARLDMGVYVAAFICWSALRHGYADRKTFYALATSAMLVVPWMVWNFATYQMGLTSASSGAAMVNHQLIIQDHGDSLLQFLKAIVYNTQYAFAAVAQSTGMLAIAAGFVGAAVALFLAGDIRITRHVPVITGLFFGGVGLFIANASVRWTMRSWYFVSILLFVVVLIVVVLDRLFPKVNYKRSVAAVLVGVTLFSFFVNWSKNLNDAMSGQRADIAAAEWMNANLSAGTSVGAFNAGIQGYFSHVRVVNLDGLINNSAYEAMREKRLWAYVHENNIEYISDFDLYMTYRYKSFLGGDPFADLTRITSIAVENGPHDAASLNIYRIQR